MSPPAAGHRQAFARGRWALGPVQGTWYQREDIAQPLRFLSNPGSENSCSEGPDRQYLCLSITRGPNREIVENLTRVTESSGAADWACGPGQGIGHSGHEVVGSQWKLRPPHPTPARPRWAAALLRARPIRSCSVPRGPLCDLYHSRPSSRALRELILVSFCSAQSLWSAP